MAVGKLGTHYREPAERYLDRIRAFWPARVIEVRQAGKADGESVRRREEAKRIRKVLPSPSHVVALAREGERWSSVQFSRELGRWEQRRSMVAFLIGGSDGLDPSLLAAADARWSLGPLTLPHQLARLIVLEQVYRAGTLRRGHPYHKGA